MLVLISRKVKFDVVVEGQPYIQSLPSLPKAIGCFFYLCFVAGLYYPEVGWGTSHCSWSFPFPGTYRIVGPKPVSLPSQKIISPPPASLEYLLPSIFLPSFLPFLPFFVLSSIFPFLVFPPFLLFHVFFPVYLSRFNIFFPQMQQRPIPPPPSP
jgi:hypothetical protein